MLKYLQKRRPFDSAFVSPLLVTGLVFFSILNVLRLLHSPPAEFPITPEEVVDILKATAYLPWLLGGIVLLVLLSQFARLPEGNSDKSEVLPGKPAKDYDLFLFSLAAFNFFLFLAPYSLLVPSPVQTPALHRESFILGYIDALHVDLNPAFILVRWMFYLGFGLTIYASCLSSILIVSLTTGLLALIAQQFCGRAVAWGMVLIMVSDHWLIAAALCGNMIATPLLSCAALLYLLVRLLYSEKLGLQATSSTRIFVFMFLLFIYSLYAYAPVRLPYLLSLAFISIAFLIQPGIPPRRKIQNVALNLLLPIILVSATIVQFAYRGQSQEFTQQLLTQPPEILGSKPQDLPDHFAENTHPDLPIWYQTVFSQQENKLLIWRGTISEILSALKTHLTRIGDELPWPPIELVLFSIAAFYGLIRPQNPHRSVLLLLTLWAFVWASSFFLTPDPFAYRRAISSSAVMLLSISLLIGQVFRRHGKLQLAMFAGLSLSLFPFDFEAKQTFALWRLSAHCQNSFSARALLQESRIYGRRLIFARSELQHPTSHSCMNDAVRSREFATRFENVEMRDFRKGEFTAVFSSVPAQSILVLDCQPDATRDPDVAEVCSGKRQIGQLHALESTHALETSSWWAWIEN